MQSPVNLAVMIILSQAFTSRLNYKKLTVENILNLDPCLLSFLNKLAYRISKHVN